MGGLIVKRKTLVVTEIKEDKLRSVSFEALQAARMIANGGDVAAVLMGTWDEDDIQIKTHIELLTHYGAETIYTVSNDGLQSYTPDGYKQALLHVIARHEPDVVIFPHTAIGRDISPRIAANMGAGLISDFTDVALEGDEVHFTRPIYAGKALQTKAFSRGKIIASIRPNNITPPAPDANRQSTTIPVKVELRDLRTIVKEIINKNANGVDLSEAKVIVAGGRGVKSQEGFEPLKKLAEVLGGAVGASRGACDAGYCEYALQIGQTGKVVTPDLYIACGISGAIQHLAGMSGSRVIVAINKDPEAPIFQLADYGIVGDLFEVVPLLINELSSDS
jgi:electron transfer flavoprotein alpha subunit